MNYEELTIEATQKHIEIIELPLKAHSGLILNTTIAIKKDIPETKKACVLAEELGHYYTSVGDILDQTDFSNRKQEHTARLWAYNKQIGLAGLVKCFEERCRNINEMADCLGVTEKFFQDALECYRQKYRISVSYGYYNIYFEPTLMVHKKSKAENLENTF